MQAARRITRRDFLTSAAGPAALGPFLVGDIAAVRAQTTSRPYAGTTLRWASFNNPYTRAVEPYLPEFTQQTGIKVQFDENSFPVYNQRADLELSGGTGVADVMTLTFIFSGRWIAAGWVRPLNDLIAKSHYDIDDFVPGTLATIRRGPKVYGIPWVAESTLMVYRKDVLAAAGVRRPPDTFQELLDVAKRVHSPTMAGYQGRGTNGVHWIWPNYLQGYGGDFFRHPPEDLAPTFYTPAAIESANVFATLYRDYSTPGVLATNEDQASGLFARGRSAIYIDAMTWVSIAADPSKSSVADKIAYAPVPRGPAGRFPQLAVHAFMIPAAARNWGASWELIRWAAGKEIMARVALAQAYPAVTRRSILNDPRFRDKYRWGGSNISGLILQVLTLSQKGYMAYRTVPVFPPIGDQVNIALGQIVSGQKSAKDAMAGLQAAAIDIEKREGLNPK